MFSTKIMSIPPEASSLLWPPNPVASWKTYDDCGGDGDDDDDVDDDHAHPLL